MDYIVCVEKVERMFKNVEGFEVAEKKAYEFQ